MGNNDIVAVGLGLNNNKIKAKAYMFSGDFFGVAAVLSICYSGSLMSRLSMASMSVVFPAIISVVIATELKSILNFFPLAILIGSFSVTLLYTGLMAVGLPSNMQDFFTGAFMLLIMVISANRPRMSHYFHKKKMIPVEMQDKVLLSIQIDILEEAYRNEVFGKC